MTPGPWHYRNHEYDDWGIVRAERGGIICQARDPEVLDEEQLNQHRVAKTDPWEANARLIAAAPELLAALQHILAGALSLPRFAQEEARAAISKALPLPVEDE